MEYRSDDNPAPVILMQFVRSNLLTLCAASICNSTLLMSSSVSLAARSFSISPKSRMFQSLSVICERFGRHRARSLSYGLIGGAIATAKSALDGAAKKLATSFNIPAGKSS